jgi:amidohydrolase
VIAHHAPAHPDTSGLRTHLDRWLAAHGAELIGLRRHLHANPELSGEEHGTAAFLAARLVEAGLAPVLLPTGNGLVCDIGPDGGPAEPDDVGPMVALRADLDALPLPDTKDVPYRSTVEGVCHACGHDVHVAVTLGAGLALAATGDLPGRVRLIFQPSEEVFPAGAPDMIAAGALEGVSAIYALHCDPKISAGVVGLRFGPLTAAADAIRITLAGPGGHTARPHNTADLVNALGRVVTEVPALLSRRVDPRAGLSLVFGAIQAGRAANAIPHTGYALGTVRVLDRDAWHAAPELITQLVHDVVAPTGVTAEVEYTRGVPPVVNEPRATAVLAAACGDALGRDALVDTPQSMGGEDFAWYLEHVPGAMARLGVGRPGEQLDLHQGSFDVDERAIGSGVRLLAHAVVAALLTAAPAA